MCEKSDEVLFFDGSGEEPYVIGPLSLYRYVWYRIARKLSETTSIPLFFLINISGTTFTVSNLPR